MKVVSGETRKDIKNSIKNVTNVVQESERYFHSRRMPADRNGDEIMYSDIIQVSQNMKE